MTTARTVPVTTEMDGDELDALDAWHLARQHGLGKIAVESFVRFRYGDGFTNSRALALQACLAVVPFLLALTGLAADIDEERPAQVVAHVVDSLSPGAGESDALTTAVEKSDESEAAGEVALVLRPRLRPGLDDDRDGPGRAGRQPHLRHPARPQGAGQVRPGGGPDRGAGRPGRHRVPDDRRRRRLRRGDGRELRVVRRRPCSGGTCCAGRVGLALLVFTIAVLLDHAPRRRQPALSWLALGSGIAVVLSALATVGLAAYVSLSGSFGSVYGPLAGIFALLLWALLSSVALFYGTAVCAQLEALRAGEADPALADPGRPHARTVDDGPGWRLTGRRRQSVTTGPTTSARSSMPPALTTSAKPSPVIRSSATPARLPVSQ